MSTLFPPRFMLYIPSRKSYSAYVLMDAAFVDNAWNLTQVVPSMAPVPNVYAFAPTPSDDPPIKLGQHTIRTPEGHLMRKQIRAHPTTNITDPAGAPVLVFSIATQNTVFGSTLKHNILFNILTFPAAVATVAVPTVAPVATPTVAPVAPTNAPTTQKKKINTNTTYIDLSPYVAKQLFELAVLRKESCPVTMEDFSAGNTAVMPCGHLFMTHAIEESFKVEADKCPWCRQKGSPTFV